MTYQLPLQNLKTFYKIIIKDDVFIQVLKDMLYSIVFHPKKSAEA